MATLKILVPDGTTNYVKNPSMRYDTAGWTAAGSTISRVLTRARFGIASLQVVTNGTVLNEGAYFRVSNLTNVSEPITVSAYVRGSGRVRIRVISSVGGSEAYSQDVDLNDTRWTRISATGRHNGSNDIRVYLETNGRAAQARTLYVDAVQMERKAYPTTYADGDQEGCRWHGTAHNSISIRSPYTRAGGRWVVVGGAARELEDLYMTVVGGMGLAPLTNNIQPYGNNPGSFFQNFKVTERLVTFTFHAKRVRLTQECDPVSLEKLHQLRQMLIDLIKPDRTGGGEEFLIEYQDGTYPLYLKVRYDGGLEGEWDIRNQWVNSFPLRVLAVSPFLTEDTQEVTALDFQNGDTSLNRIAARVDGEWQKMNYGFASVAPHVEALEISRRGEVIAGGTMTTANNNAAAIDPNLPVGCISYWDGDQWRQFAATGVSGAGVEVNALAVAPNGDIYITGSFTAVGGVAASRVAKWNGSAWSALGTGLSGGGGLAIKVAPNGDVYVGGGFTSAGGKPCQHIARFDGSTWHTLGTLGGLNNDVNGLWISPDGDKIYAGGSFTDEYSLAASALLYVAEYDVSANTFSALGDGFNGAVRAVRLSPSGILYAAGDFTLSGTQSVPRIAQWNGSNWTGLGNGINGSVYALDISPDGDILATGDFTSAGGVDVLNLALWNGSTWVNLDFQWSGSGSNQIVRCCIYNQANGNLYIGGGTGGIFAGKTLVTNLGSAEVSPKIYILGPGTLRRLENWTTSKRMFLDLDVLNGEEVTIDFGRAQITSSVRGDLSHTILPGSDFSAISLVPGENKIMAFMTNDVSATMQISHTPRHWSADATQATEEL